MKKIIMRMFIIILVMALCTGCSVKEIGFNTNDDIANSVSFEAMVISQNNNSLSVISLDADKGFRRFDPVYVSYDASDLKVTMGDIVIIRFNGAINESYPCQIGADKIEIKDKVNDNWPATSSISEDYPVDAATQDNCFVMALDKVKSKDLLDSFVDNTMNGMIGFLRRVTYTVEGDPIITDIIYNGEKYFVFEDDSRDKFSSAENKIYKKEYRYINTYQKKDYQTIYLANRNDITEEEYEKSLYSSNSNDLIDSYPLYYEFPESSN